MTDSNLLMLKRSWTLLKVLLSSFPPSKGLTKDFVNWITGYRSLAETSYKHLLILDPEAENHFFSKADIISYQSSLTTLMSAPEWCIMTVKKMVLVGARRNPLSRLEFEHISHDEKMLFSACHAD